MKRINVYPRGCALCATETVFRAFIPHVASVVHDGERLVITIEALAVDRCSRCGEVYFTNESSDQISAAVRAKLGLLQTEEILQRANELGISPSVMLG